MDSEGTPQDSPEAEATQEAGLEHYRSITDVFELAINSDEFPSGQIRRLELNLLASGEATWNVITTDLEDSVGGYLEAES